MNFKAMLHSTDKCNGPCTYLCVWALAHLQIGPLIGHSSMLLHLNGSGRDNWSYNFQVSFRGMSKAVGEWNVNQQSGSQRELVSGPGALT